MIMENKVYVFDFDGTLADSMPHLLGVLLGLLDEYGIKYEEDIIDKIIPMGYQRVSEYYNQLGVPMSAEEIFRTLLSRQVELYSSSKIQLKEGVLTVLKRLKKRGERLFIFSGSTMEMLTPCAKRFGFEELFEGIFAVDGFHTTKAKKEAYEILAEKIGVSCETCLFFDDNYTNLATAKSVGMRVFGVKDSFSKDSEERIKEVSERYIQNFSDVLEV